MRRNAEFIELVVTRDEAIAEAPTPADLTKRRLCPVLAAWVVVHYDTMADGTWPEVQPEQIPSHGGAYRHGPFEMPVLYAAEISSRVKECGDDGAMLWAYYHDGLPPADCRRINRALAYCSGWRHKRRGYSDWYRRHYTGHVAKVHAKMA